MTFNSLTQPIKSTRSTRPSTFGQRGLIAPAPRINHEKNADKYEPAEVEQIKDRIKKAAKQHDVDIEAD